MHSLRNIFLYLSLTGAILSLGIFSSGPVFAGGSARPTLSQDRLQRRIPQLQSPWILFQNRMRGTIGSDPRVHIQDIVQLGDTHFRLDIQTTYEREKAILLASVLLDRFEDPYWYEIRVTDKNQLTVPRLSLPTSIGALSGIYHEVLAGNPYFVKILPGNLIYGCFLEFSDRVVQYAADNKADAHDNWSEVPRDAFYSVLTLPVVSKKVGWFVGTSTIPIHTGRAERGESKSTSATLYPTL